MKIKQAINAVIKKQDLSFDEMTEIMQDIMTGECTDAQIAAFVVGLRMKGETVEEISAAAKTMRHLSAKVHVQSECLVDTCGTGGDNANTFNISTVAAFVAAAGGARVAKHGNRSVSSKSGSADLLELAGVKLDLPPGHVAECIRKLGIGFMFAPMYHSAMKYAAGPRREIGIRTLFNLLGPLTNPAVAPNQLIGVSSRRWLKPMVEVLHKLGSNHVLAVHAEDGLDEISITATTHITELRDNQINIFTVAPADFGLESAMIEDIGVTGVEKSLEMMNSVLNDDPGPARDIVCLNAGAALYVADICKNLNSGVQYAAEVIASGKAKEKLEELISLSQIM